MVLEGFLSALINSTTALGLTEGFGLVILFIISILVNATILVPIPLDLFVPLIVATIPHDFNGLITAMAVSFVLGFGSAIGGMTSYIAGLAGMTIVEKKHNREAEKVIELMDALKKKGGAFVIFSCMLLPFLSDFVGVAAGLIKYDWKKFFWISAAGRIVRYGLLVFAIYFGIEILKIYFGV